MATRRSSENNAYYKPGQNIEEVKVSPFATLASYSYAVHLIGPDHLPESPMDVPQYYVVYRNEEYQVQFVHLTAMTAMLVHTIEGAEEGISLVVLANQLIEQAPSIPQSTLTAGMEQTVIELLQKRILMLA